MGFLDVIFGCTHKHYSFPITVRGARRRSAAASVTGTYVVCLDCGQEFPYDWNKMQLVRKPSPTPATIATEPGRVIL